MNILFISSFYLFKGTRFGGTKRLYYFAKEWRKTANLTLICMDGCREWEARTPRDGEFSDFLMVPGYDAPGWFGHSFHAPSDRTAFLEAKAGEIRSFLAGKRFDAILLAYPWSLSFLGGILDGIEAPIFFLDDDLILERFRDAAKDAANPFTRALKMFRYRQTLGYFRERLAKAGHFIGISPQEVRVAQGLFPKLKPNVIKYGIPLEEYPFLPAPANPCVLGFIGNYFHAPNLDALEWLDQEVVPAILKRRPTARFVIAGRGLPVWMLAKYREHTSVEFRENVLDLRDFYAEIALFINPVRTGRGLRTKLIEAAAFGRPIVSTGLGAEGLDDLLISRADTADAFAVECERLFAEPEAEGVTRVNRMTVEASYALPKVAGAFLDILAESARNRFSKAPA